jgi:hypothetical protein
MCHNIFRKLHFLGKELLCYKIQVFLTQKWYAESKKCVYNMPIIQFTIERKEVSTDENTLSLSDGDVNADETGEDNEFDETWDDFDLDEVFVTNFYT